MTVKPVIALDIDGTLLNYHRHYTLFANGYFGIEADPDGYDARLPFYKYLGVSKAAYRRCKLAYRRGELKRSLPPLEEPYPDARSLTRSLRSWGVDIWLCTTRPYLSHDAVDDATRHNLRRNGVAYQGLIWGQHKYRELVRTVGRERIVGVLDDLPEMCSQATAVGLRTAFALRRHNERQLLTGTYSGEPWQVARTHDDTLVLFRRWLEEWREARRGTTGAV